MSRNNEIDNLLNAGAINSVGKALGMLMDGKADVSEYIETLHALEEDRSLYMFGYTIGDIAAMCLALNGYPSTINKRPKAKAAVLQAI